MPVKKGDQCLVALYEDKSHRLCATMKVYPYLHVQSPYRLNDTVKGRVYEISKRFGVFVAVDDQYSALIPAKEAQGNYRVNDILELRVTQVEEGICPAGGRCPYGAGKNGGSRGCAVSG